MNDTKIELKDYRKIPADILRLYRCEMSTYNGSDNLTYVYPNGSRQHRRLDSKKFKTTGSVNDTLFGMDIFPQNSTKFITVTEGANDAMAVRTMMGPQSAAVAVTSASSALAQCRSNFDYLNSFQRIYLSFDADEQGIQAREAVAKLFNPNKIYVVEHPDYKDAHEYLENGQEKAYRASWWAAKPYKPRNIVSSNDSILNVLNTKDTEPLAEYPLVKLQEMTYGIRPGEFNLLTALEGRGKTSLVRYLEYHLIKNTDLNIGIIHLEEPEHRTIKGLLNYEFKKPVHLPDHSLPVPELMAAYEKMVQREGRISLYAHFGSDDPDNILGIIRYLVQVMECRIIFLDHITMIMSGNAHEDERKGLDYLSTKLKSLCQELNCTLFVVSHVNDQGDTRGSRYISKVADLWIHMDRDVKNPDELVRNTTKLTINKNRFGATTGPCGYLLFDPETHCVEDRTSYDETKTTGF